MGSREIREPQTPRAFDGILDLRYLGWRQIDKAGFSAHAARANAGVDQVAA